jgi:hypothetical protein
MKKIRFNQNIIKWLAKAPLLSFLRKIIGRIIVLVILSKNGELIWYKGKRLEIINLIKKIRAETELLIGNIEAYQIFIMVKKMGKIDGDTAEVGVYKGGSAKLICEAKGNKPLHLFDTFEGLPDRCPKDNSKFYKGQFAASIESVKDYLNRYPHVYFYQGVFPTTTKSVENKKFSFVNLDVDLYKSTLDCLSFFYPRMNKGGIIISHDYISSAYGVREAFDEFFSDKPEPVLELSGSQCMVVKL